MDNHRMLEWIGTHDVGISSRTMWCGCMGIRPASESNSVVFDVPHDAADFGRCFDLVTFANISPDDDFPRIGELFPFFKPVLDCWGELTELYLDKNYEGVYRLLSSKHDEVMRMMGYEKVGHGSWVKTTISKQ